MSKSVAMITEAQIRKIWVESKKLNLTEEDIHKVLVYEYRVKSLKELTKKQATCIIDEMVSASDISGMITSRQAWKIEDLIMKLGWDTKSMQSYIKKYGHVENMKWLTDKKASGIINGLTKILKSKQLADTSSK